jgi:transcriptional regulator with XRE-family HTH domain
MIERILELLKVKGLSPSQFADEIGVQRSAISHLITGRNNPSLDFILKILKRFPDVSSDWLLTGSGGMDGQGQAEAGMIKEDDLQEEIPLNYEIPEVPRPQKPRKETVKERRVEKILMIFNDNTFRELKPEKD